MKMRCNKFSSTSAACKKCPAGEAHEKNDSCNIRGCDTRPGAKNAVCKPVDEGKRA